MKYKDFFKRLKDQAKLTNPDFDKFIESAPDAEFPDDLLPEFENNFMTLDRAASHPEINKKHRMQILTPVEERVQEILEAIEKVDQPTAIQLAKIQRTTQDGKVVPDTYKMLEGIKNVLPDVFKKAGKVTVNDEELKKQLTSKDQIISDLTEKFKKVETEYSSKEKSLSSEYENKISAYRLNAALERMASSYTFAEHFEGDGVRDVLTKAKLDELKASNVLKLVENNGKEEVAVFALAADGTPTPKFNGNSPVTIKSLMDDSFKSYIKQNNAEPPPINPRQHTPTTQQGARVPRSTTVVQ